MSTARDSLVEFGRGWVSGVCGLVAGYPLETVKVTLETDAPDTLITRPTAGAMIAQVEQERRSVVRTT